MSSCFLLLWLLRVGLGIILLIDAVSSWLGYNTIDLIELVLNLLTLSCHVESTIDICSISSETWVSRECLSIHQIVIIVISSASSCLLLVFLQDH